MTDAPAGWDDAAVRSPGGHVMQSSAWARIREQQGWRAEFVRIGDPTPCALVLWRDVPVLGRMAYAPRGPVHRDADELRRALDALAALARERGAVLLKVDPEVAELRHPLYRRGPDVQPVLATLIVDLSPDPDALMASLEKDTRWSVRQCEKRGVTVRVANDEESLRAFYDLYRVTGERAGFITRTWEYYRLVWRTLIDAGFATLRLAHVDDRAVAGSMTWRCGERDLYMYGATSDEGRKTFAAYGLLWRSIVAAKERGATSFDLGGIPVDPSRTDDPMHGPYLFKKGFGGEIRRWAGAHDVAPNALRYRAFVTLEPVYTRALQLLPR